MVRDEPDSIGELSIANSGRYGELQWQLPLPIRRADQPAGSCRVLPPVLQELCIKQRRLFHVVSQCPTIVLDRECEQTADGTLAAFSTLMIRVSIKCILH